MSTLNFIITDAGRQAAITADATGIQLTITEVGYGTSTWIPDSTATALQSELKRLAAGGGENPAPLYVHIAVTDQSSDSYQANEVGIYAGEVLFAVWSKGGQTAADGPGKINTQDSAFVFDLLLDNVPPDSVTVGDANFSYPIATENKYGVAKIATPEQVSAGAGGPLIVSPSMLSSWYFSMMKKWFMSQVWVFGTDDLPEDFPGFIHNGSTVPNGAIDYPDFANSGYKWITIDGPDLIIHDAPDVIRGQGSSARAVGDFEGDATRKITGSFNTGSERTNASYADGAFTVEYPIGISVSTSWTNRNQFQAILDSSNVVPTASENRMKSKTGLIACYHGEFTK